MGGDLSLNLAGIVIRSCGLCAHSFLTSPHGCDQSECRGDRKRSCPVCRSVGMNWLGVLDDAAFLDAIVVVLIGERKCADADEGMLRAMDIERLARLATESFLKQDSMIPIDPPVTAVGDIHGQFRDSLALFKDTGFPPKNRFLFLGDYVDRGSRSGGGVPAAGLQSALPNDVFLIRGNHESRCINRTYGFYSECVERYSTPVWGLFQSVFNMMPLCALVGGRVFCAHGGLPRHSHNLTDINQIKRPLEVPDEGLVCDLLWSDPSKNTKGWEDNAERGVSHVFGEDAVMEFCRRFDIDLMVRAHQMFQNGYDIFADGRLITIFSAPNYAGCYTNSAALLNIDNDLVCRIKVLEPQRARPVDDTVTSEEEGPVAAADSCSPGARPKFNLWMRRALNQLQNMFEDEGCQLYHPSQPDPPRRWWRTTLSAGESHLSYRSTVKAPIELSILVQGAAPNATLNFKASVDGTASPIVYTMAPRPEYEQRRVPSLDEVVKEEVRESFFKKVIEAANTAPPKEQTGGLTNTINWFSSWLYTNGNTNPMTS